MLDVNAGIPMADEPAILAGQFSWCKIPLTCRLPLSSIVAALEAGLSVYRASRLSIQSLARRNGLR